MGRGGGVIKGSDMLGTRKFQNEYLTTNIPYAILYTFLSHITYIHNVIMGEKRKDETFKTNFLQIRKIPHEKIKLFGKILHYL